MKTHALHNQTHHRRYLKWAKKRNREVMRNGDHTELAYALGLKVAAYHAMAMGLMSDPDLRIIRHNRRRLALWKKKYTFQVGDIVTFQKGLRGRFDAGQSVQVMEVRLVRSKDIASTGHHQHLVCNNGSTYSGSYFVAEEMRYEKTMMQRAADHYEMECMMQEFDTFDIEDHNGFATDPNGPVYAERVGRDSNMNFI